jgi:hypothetical protein
MGNTASGNDPAFSFKFSRLFQGPQQRLTPIEWGNLYSGLIQLGLKMSCSGQPLLISDIPAGYTYLGQFIAHEITYDNRPDLPMLEFNPQSLRSPEIDLDSLYGPQPRNEKSRMYYEDNCPARLKVSPTLSDENGKLPFPNDLPRDPTSKSAIIPDERNDENLALAQTHLAFIKFHNQVVNALRASGHSESDLFDCARIQVIKHFQWIILHDFLRRVVAEDVLEDVLSNGCKHFNPQTPDELTMPLEFSAAAFRFGHSMVRNQYQWNIIHAEDLGGRQALLGELFARTELNGGIGCSVDGLERDWVIDWTRFYEFPNCSLPDNLCNKALRIDTYFEDFSLANLRRPPPGLPKNENTIPVRNLLRGFALGLPTGEEMAAFFEVKNPLTPEQVADGPYREILNTPIFYGKTPLWYYILKEAELSEKSRLGPVGGRIVAETLYSIIRNSQYSIIDTDWRPKYPERPEGERPYEMIDLLEFAKIPLDPYAL